MICNKLVDPNCSQATNPTRYTNNIIQTGISLLIIVGIIFFVFNFIMAGYSFITSQGDPKIIESAKSKITNAFIGLIVIFSLFAILRLIGVIFSIPELSSLNLSWPTL